MPDGKQVRLLNEVEPPLLRQFTDEVAELIVDRLPLMFPPEDRWPPIAHGFLARAGTLLEAVDRYWSEHSRAFRSLEATADGFPSILTFTGFYTAVYRKGSRLIHADMSSPDRFATMPLLGQATIHAAEKHTESNDYPAFAAPLVGFLLIVFEDQFGWPAREVIDAATNVLMYRDD